MLRTIEGGDRARVARFKIGAELRLLRFRGMPCATWRPLYCNGSAMYRREALINTSSLREINAVSQPTGMLGTQLLYMYGAAGVFAVPEKFGRLGAPIPIFKLTASDCLGRQPRANSAPHHFPPLNYNPQTRIPIESAGFFWESCCDKIFSFLYPALQGRPDTEHGKIIRLFYKYLCFKNIRTFPTTKAGRRNFSVRLGTWS